MPSGKSSFAEEYAAGSGKKVVYIATAAAEDPEMQRRIEKHRWRRPSAFFTREEPLHSEKLLGEYGRAVNFILLDCLTVFFSNPLLRDYKLTQVKN